MSEPKMVIAEAERLSLRHVHGVDLDALVALFADSEVTFLREPLTLTVTHVKV